jgi:hypothetical protein
MMRAKKLSKALCPKCEQFGFFRKMDIPSNYYPKFWSVKCTLLEGAINSLSKNPSSKFYKKRVAHFRNIVRGYVKGDSKEFRGRSKKHLQDNQYTNKIENIKDKKSLVRVTYGKYPCMYIGHYDKEKYKKEMIRYHQGQIKSRPNGRRWCKLPRYYRNQYQIVNDPIEGKYIKFYKQI